jgi:acyl dehydratase
MPLNLEFLRAWQSEERQRYDERDSIIYALGAGAGSEPDELQYVYEKELRTLPTMAVALATSTGRWFCDPRSGVELSQVFHGAQELEVHQSLPPSGEVVAHTKIDAIIDKGPGRHAVVVQSRTLRDSTTDALMATAKATLIARGAGGFGGGDSLLPTELPIPERSCDSQIVLETRKDQAALYRLSGDMNPLHIDPTTARLSGFDRPVLHGLCTYAMAGRAIVRSVCNGDPGHLQFLSTRFVAPVFPGDALKFELWWAGTDTVVFRASVPERDVVVLGNGLARYES